MNISEHAVARMVAIATAVSLAFTLTACVTPEQFEEAIVPAVADAHPAIVDVHVSSSTGLAGIGPWVRVYVEPGTEDLASVIDASLRALLVASPERPPSWRLDLAEGPKPDDVNLNLGALDIEEAARELDLYDTYSSRTLSGVTEILEERYGTWEELHE